ncbi:iron-sulfur cluster repair di-iron protein [Actinomarinicola tropica]|uniref:Iron-sulfur cluster repair di-iron protein n=1 Tax=Actinomarinicola tropica TaxID=2789776 RepID=A0A5Q2RFP9_9ACTN|nr:iron-sulfur cluster repair di-iron protein [Actinomarinicola tropica]QGG94474.1 iron-sulfur cluster repair di-iron protein [Actinomarinicola tropica]
MTTTHVDPRATLGELVKERSTRARVLEHHGIDYCCHGHRPLDEAAAEAGIDLDLLVAELAGSDAGTGADDVERTPVELVDHIVETHHAYLHEELPLLQELAHKVESVHGVRHPELVSVAALVRAVVEDLVPHLAEEETVVFPAIRRHVDAGEDVPGELVERLRDDHEATGALLGELRSVTDGYQVPGDACASYTSLYERLAALEADTFRHIHLENNVLFPALSG